MDVAGYFTDSPWARRVDSQEQTFISIDFAIAEQWFHYKQQNEEKVGSKGTW